mmetsp:Transcript_52526/g.128376  ORF Transcript_52526/g.128376 Transcript_52526/m.128376 type:complete len:447 (-) Transcript_52526:1265-2605(-)
MRGPGTKRRALVDHTHSLALLAPRHEHPEELHRRESLSHEQHLLTPLIPRHKHIVRHHIWLTPVQKGPHQSLKADRAREVPMPSTQAPDPKELAPAHRADLVGLHDLGAHKHVDLGPHEQLRCPVLIRDLHPSLGVSKPQRARDRHHVSVQSIDRHVSRPRVEFLERTCHRHHLIGRAPGRPILVLHRRHIIGNKRKVVQNHADEQIEHNVLAHKHESDKVEARVGRATVPERVVLPPALRPPVHLGGAEDLRAGGGGDAEVDHDVLPFVACHHLVARRHRMGPRVKVGSRANPPPVASKPILLDSHDSKHRIHQKEQHQNVEELRQANNKRLHNDPNGLDHLHQPDHPQDPEALDKRRHTWAVGEVPNSRPQSHKQVESLPRVVHKPPRPVRPRVDQDLSDELAKEDGVLDVHDVYKPLLRVRVISEHEAEIDKDTRSREELKVL